jgi:tellurite resistance protein TerC
MATLALWLVFFLIVAGGLVMDVIHARRSDLIVDHRWSACAVIWWVSIASMFGVLVACLHGSESALNFFAGYVLELSLSVDNLFAFMAIFRFFRIDAHAQRRALTYGIIGAIAMRMIFIFLGIVLLDNFGWLMYALGTMLIFSAFGMLKKEKAGGCLWKFFEKIGFIRRGGKDAHYIRSGKSRVAPFIMCIIAIELMDLIFAVDSVSAVLAITRVPVLVFSSNIFAIIGLRALYVYLSHLSSKLHLLNYGIAVILAFIGAKMLFANVFPVSTAASISVIATILTATVVASHLTVKK